MPIDIAVLATTIVTSYLFPYAKLGAEKVAEAVGQKVSETAADNVIETGKKVWYWVKSIFIEERDKAIFEQFEEMPDAAKNLMEAMLKNKLEQNPALAQELSELINNPMPDGSSTGAQIMNASIAGILDARGANFAGATNTNLAGVVMREDSAKLPAQSKSTQAED